MVARLEEEGAPRPGPVRDALLTLPREVLMPQAYVRRTAPGEKPSRWDLLDRSAPQDRPELLEVPYGVRDFGAEHLVIGAPGCGSWLRAEPVGASRWNVITHGPRDIWKEIQDPAGRWRSAGRQPQPLPPGLRAGRRPADRTGVPPSVLAPAHPRPLDEGAST
ncbi:hypothetical protein OG780_36735 [Streptomyces sp. NBC_00386]|jgi:hypothetical protein|uniref:hypothetical protein n=1 Tax=Streptomyces sp. NBC_00386 TaxID=2975734 RepID=UPI002E230C4F